MGADGVHVGREDTGLTEARKQLGVNAVLGGSAHTVEEALAAQAAGADYLGCGAVFGSGTKHNVRQMSLETLTAICQAVDIPTWTTCPCWQAPALPVWRSSADSLPQRTRPQRRKAFCSSWRV